MTRIAHHLISRSLLDPTPIGCALDYETAARFVAEEGGIVSLRLTTGENPPCPVCDDGPIAVVSEGNERFGVAGFVDPKQFRKD